MTAWPGRRQSGSGSGERLPGRSSRTPPTRRSGRSAPRSRPCSRSSPGSNALRPSRPGPPPRRDRRPAGLASSSGRPGSSGCSWPRQSPAPPPTRSRRCSSRAGSPAPSVACAGGPAKPPPQGAVSRLPSSAWPTRGLRSSRRVAPSSHPRRRPPACRSPPRSRKPPGAPRSSATGSPPASRWWNWRNHSPPSIATWPSISAGS